MVFVIYRDVKTLTFLNNTNLFLINFLYLIFFYLLIIFKLPNSVSKMYLTLLWPGLDATAGGATELHRNLLTPGLGGELLNTLLRHRAHLSRSSFLCLLIELMKGEISGLDRFSVTSVPTSHQFFNCIL